MRKIFLYGAPGSGKTTIGRKLAENLGLIFIDLDLQIEDAAGMPISQIIGSSGETIFRDMEAAAIAQVCAAPFAEVGGCVVALGGGALLRAGNREQVQAAGTVIFLDVALPVLLSRLSAGEEQRPLLAGDPQAKLVGLLENRNEHYASFEKRIVVSDDNPAGQVKSPELLAWEIQRYLGLYHVRGMGLGYDVIVQPGGIDQLGWMLKERGLTGPVMVVSDENIAPYYAGRVMAALAQAGLAAQVQIIPAGEEFKTLETVAGLWRGFLQAGLDRKSTVVALGGGVVSDLAGFAAATFMRGCAWVVVPTTLLAMVDASLGGKTGFDLPEGKNLVGAFHSPRLVLADPDVLATLPSAELRSGLAEVVKHGIISDPELFEMCAQGYEAVMQDLPRLVRRAIAVKALVIETDPFEKGVRASLNLGHTVGHAVEIVSGFSLRHGEAVAIGTVVEARLAEQLSLAEPGFAKRLAQVFAGLGLPVDIPAQQSVEAIIARMKFDKKKSNHIVRFALPTQVGTVVPSYPVADLEAVFSAEFLFSPGLS